MSAQPIIRAAIHAGLLFLVSLVVNYVWEMLQMPFYAAMSFSNPISYSRCLFASVGDAAIVVGIFILGRVLFRTLSWPEKLTPTKAIYLILIGSAIAIIIEVVALKADRWAYSSLMPLIPFFEVGIVPVVQLMVLPFISFSLTRGFFRKQAP